jgi:hypothetical protein
VTFTFTLPFLYLIAHFDLGAGMLPEPAGKMPALRQQGTLLLLYLFFTANRLGRGVYRILPFFTATGTLRQKPEIRN